MNREDISDTDEENKLNAFVTALLPAAHWGPGVGGSHALYTRAALLPHIQAPIPQGVTFRMAMPNIMP